jgi:hypothetical protein
LYALIGYGGGSAIDENTVGCVVVKLVMDAVLKTAAEPHKNYQDKYSPGNIKGGYETSDFVLSNGVKDLLPLVYVKHF